MLKSMTGFGRGVAEEGGSKITVDVKSVNNRFFDVQVRMPRDLQSLEVLVRQLCQKKISRGKLDISISWTDTAESDDLISVDLNLAKSYARALNSIAAAVGQASDYQADPYRIATFPQVLQNSSGETDLDKWQSLITEACNRALDALVEMREAEGVHLEADIREKLDQLRRHRLSVLERAPEVITAYRERLVEKLDQLMTERAEEVFGENRLAAEVLVFADKATVDEELVRLDSHFNAMEEILSASGNNGKKLDFIIQEMNREINTIGSKANDLTVTQEVVEMKTLVEKIREQIQNIE